MSEETVTISKKEYYDLQEDSLWLSCLSDAGVDNWSGYDFAMKEFQELKDELGY